MITLETLEEDRKLHKHLKYMDDDHKYLHTLPKPNEQWKQTQLKFYKDPVPHRHKVDIKERKATNKSKNHSNTNAPLYSVHQTLDGEERRFTYVESRYFYCCAYETLAKETEDFKKLKKMLDDGYNLRICGYDAFPMDDLFEEEKICDDYIDRICNHYENVHQSFGHERVLHSLLFIDDHKQYPWHRYRYDNRGIYWNIAHVLTLNQKIPKIYDLIAPSEDIVKEKYGYSVRLSDRDGMGETRPFFRKNESLKQNFDRAIKQFDEYCKNPQQDPIKRGEYWTVKLYCFTKKDKGFVLIKIYDTKEWPIKYTVVKYV